MIMLIISDQTIPKPRVPNKAICLWVNTSIPVKRLEWEDLNIHSCELCCGFSTDGPTSNDRCPYVVRGHSHGSNGLWSSIPLWESLSGVYRNPYFGIDDYLQYGFTFDHGTYVTCDHVEFSLDKYEHAKDQVRKTRFLKPCHHKNTAQNSWQALGARFWIEQAHIASRLSRVLCKPLAAKICVGN